MLAMAAGGAAPRGRDPVRAAVMGVLDFGLSPRLQVAGVQMDQAANASLPWRSIR
jgi:hypothetical protein